MIKVIFKKSRLGILVIQSTKIYLSKNKHLYIRVIYVLRSRYEINKKYSRENERY